MSTAKLIESLLVINLMLICNISIAAPQNILLKTESCLSCHSDPGLSTNPLQPSLDGQNSSYLISQLISFDDGSRIHGKVDVRVLELSKQETLSLAAFFAERLPKESTQKNTGMLLGTSKYNTCIGCHGVGGEGLGNYPRLAGLQPAYISKQLMDYKNKKRPNDTMRVIAQKLSDQDIAKLASYIGSL